MLGMATIKYITTLPEIIDYRFWRCVGVWKLGNVCQKCYCYGAHSMRALKMLILDLLRVCCRDIYWINSLMQDCASSNEESVLWVAYQCFSSAVNPALAFDGWNFLSIPKLQQLQLWCLGMDKPCYHTVPVGPTSSVSLPYLFPTNLFT